MKEVVIKISDAMYKYITMEHTICIKEVGEYLFGLVRCTGTLLPKGHGRLIDTDRVVTALFFDAMHKEWVIKQMPIYECINQWTDEGITTRDIIIEADKENE